MRWRWVWKCSKIKTTMHRCQKTTVKIKNKEFIACVIYIFFILRPLTVSIIYIFASTVYLSVKIFLMFGKMCF